MWILDYVLLRQCKIIPEIVHSLGGGNKMRCYGDLEFPARPNMPLPWCIRVVLVSGKRNDPDRLSA